MHKLLFDDIHEQMPHFNPIIADGLAVSQIPNCEAFIDQIFSSVSKGFTPGLKYEGYSRCTPQEEYNEITNKRGTKRYCEISKSDIYLVKYMFSFNGKPLYPRYIYLPFVTSAGIISMRGSRFMISPVLSDRILSVEYNSIFIVLNCAKLKFERIVQHYMANGNIETVNVVWAPVHNEYRKKKGKFKPNLDACTTLAHYLFCKYGVVNTFKLFTDTDVVIGEDEINEETYPSNKWIICGTVGNKPAKLKERYYYPTAIKIAIPIDKYNQVNRSLIGGLFYIIEHFTDRFKAEYFGGDSEKTLWKILLGHLIFSSGSSEGELSNKVEEHFISLDEYIDEMDQINLLTDGISVENIYQLFMHVIETMPERLLNVGNSVSSMYDKQLTILRYLLYDIRSAIVKVRFKLHKSNAKRPLTADDIVKVMNRELPREMICNINRDHGEVTSISSPGDNKIFKITSNILMQTKSGANSRSKGKGKVNDPSKILHSSIAEVASFINLPQSDPTGRSRINPHLQIAHDGTVLRNEKFRTILDDIQMKIDR